MGLSMTKSIIRFERSKITKIAKLVFKFSEPVFDVVKTGFYSSRNWFLLPKFGFQAHKKRLAAL